VECIDDPSRQVKRGWDLAGWRYRLVQWGVVFSQPNHPGGQSEILVMTGLDGTRIIVAGEPVPRTTAPLAEMQV
jgi:hypothetical protein